MALRLSRIRPGAARSSRERDRSQESGVREHQRRPSELRNVWWLWRKSVYRQDQVPRAQVRPGKSFRIAAKRPIRPIAIKFDMLPCTGRIMRRTLVLTALAFGGAVYLCAQSEADLRDSFEGRTVVVKQDLPASKTGIDIFPTRPHRLITRITADASSSLELR